MQFELKREKSRRLNTLPLDYRCGRECSVGFFYFAIGLLCRSDVAIIRVRQTRSQTVNMPPQHIKSGAITYDLIAEIFFRLLHQVSDRCMSNRRIRTAASARKRTIFKRPKLLARAKLDQERRKHGHHFINHPDTAFGRALPAWPYSSGWGYWPSGGVGLILLIIIVLALTGHL